MTSAAFLAALGGVVSTQVVMLAVERDRLGRTRGVTGTSEDVLRSLLPPIARSMQWTMLGLDDLERFQAHLSGGGIDTASTFRHSLHSRRTRAAIR